MENMELQVTNNMPYDEELIIDDNFENNCIIDEIYSIYPPTPIETCGYDIGVGNFDYINNNIDREIITNAWQAITLTQTWSFIAEDIDSFMFSNEPRLNTIYKKMEELGYEGHSGSSFGITLRYMQYLAQNGEEGFKKLFIR
jgi:hypothetical protein